MDNDDPLSRIPVGGYIAVETDPQWYIDLVDEFNENCQPSLSRDDIDAQWEAFCISKGRDAKRVQFHLNWFRLEISSK